MVEHVSQNQSGSLCPTLKAADIIGDKWILLILRELFLGSSRYNDFQRALPRISPTVLSKRLKQLEANGLVIRKTTAGDKSKEYRLTRSGRDLWPIIEHMAVWGLRWARMNIREEDFDVGNFMWDFHRTLNTEELPDGETVLCVNFSDLSKYRKWWLVAQHLKVELCTDDPGKDVDLYLTADLPTVAEIWMGDANVDDAIRSQSLKLMGASYLSETAARWFPKSMFAHIRPETEDNDLPLRAQGTGLM